MDRYLIWSHEHAAWWGPASNGYTRAVTQAGRYTYDDAMDICAAALPGTANRMRAFPELPVREAEAMLLRDRYIALYPHDPDAV